MPKIIKLENIVSTGYDRPSGEAKTKETVEYVCEVCRHLVEATDKFCWHCGSSLEASRVVEHWHKGEKLTEKEFSNRKAHLR